MKLEDVKMRHEDDFVNLWAVYRRVALGEHPSNLKNMAGWQEYNRLEN